MRRGKRALTNTMFSMLYQIVTFACGFILPRLILTRWGSDYNGLVSSVTQFLSCIALLKSGITGVSQAALYKPLAENDFNRISGIMKATENFMKKISGIFCVSLVAFAAVYPFFVSDEFNYLFTFTLVMILGLSSVFQYYFGITNQILLAADQKLYVYNVLQIFAVIANTFSAALLINIGCSIHIVKLASALIFAATPVLLYIYVRKKYKIKKDVPADTSAIKQRWDSFAHSVSEFIHTNTDVIVLTVFTSMKEVSVYSVYNLVIRGIKMIEMTFVSGVEAAFGNMIAKKETDLLKRNFAGYETMIFITSIILYTCTAILLPSFISVYTKNITDADYIRPMFAYIISCAEFFYCIRIPYNMVVHASGYFKQTKKYAITEAVLNIVISVVLVNFISLTGVAIGTLVAMVYRTFVYVYFTDKNIIDGVWKSFLAKLVAFAAVGVLLFLLTIFIPVPVCNSYSDWIIVAIIVFCLTVLLTFGISLLFFRDTTGYITKKIIRIVKK